MNQNFSIILLVVLVFIVLFYKRRESFGASTGGALIQLVAKDAQDSYLIGGPRPYTPYPYYYYNYYPFFSYYPYGFDFL